MSLVKPNQYDVPASLEVKTALLEMWPMLFAIVPVAVFLPFRWVEHGFDTAIVVMLGFLAFLIALTIYGFFYTKKHRAVRYTVDGITVVWADKRYYVPPRLYRDFVDAQVWQRFRPFADDPKILTRGIVMVYEGTKPYVPVRQKNGKVGYKYVWGATWPWLGISRVAAFRRLDEGTDGHELRLHACQYLFPGRPEGEDIAWMTEEGVH